MHPLQVQNFGSQENSRVQREQPHSQKKNCYHVKQVCHILIEYIQKQIETRKHKTENAFVRKILEFTREILNSDDVLKNSQYIYIYMMI